MSKYTILKNEDVTRYGTDEQQQALYDLGVEIALNRVIDGKQPFPQYLVINQDEPYAEEVISIMRKHGHWEGDEDDSV
ncbi:hypothetical protein D070_13540 [Bacillus velezensis]|uniref:hypothetical protein n=1 Tax=Bacillus velezensis TaxID=492670 RepID=UPI00112AC819|nr:hypothetical protein [Bacillus velezensis]